MLVWISVFVVSIAAMALAARKLIEAAQALAAMIGVSGFVIGATVVAVGTSLPELFSGIAAATRGAGDLVPAIVVGSNIFNATAVVGICALAVPRLVVDGSRRMAIFVGTAITLAVMLFDGRVTAFEGMVATALGVIALISLARRGVQEQRAHHPRPRGAPLGQAAWVLAMALALNIAAAGAVESVIGIAGRVGVSASLIALIALAAGTSLPELVVSLVAARRHAYGLSLGNIIGSNIVNATLVLGIPALIAPLTVPSSVQPLGIAVMLAATGLLIVASFLKRLTKFDALMLIGVYIVFLISTLSLGGH